MDTDDPVKYTVMAMVSVCVILMLMLPVAIIGRNVGKTQVVGYVVNVEQASWPYSHTKVTFTIEHPTSIVDAHYFSRTYYYYHEFELHQRYRITAKKGWFEWYPRITEKMVID